jgi:hypothetical protein
MTDLSFASVPRRAWTATCPCGAIRAAAMEADNTTAATHDARRKVSSGRPGHKIAVVDGAFSYSPHAADCTAPRPSKPVKA